MASLAQGCGSRTALKPAERVPGAGPGGSPDPAPELGGAGQLDAEAIADCMSLIAWSTDFSPFIAAYEFSSIAFVTAG